MGGSTEAIFLSVLEETRQILETRGFRYVFFGGVASAAYVDPDWLPGGSDIDVLIDPTEATDALEAFSDAGFSVTKKDPTWIFKAARPDVTVDLIFRAIGNISLDGEMHSRARELEFKGLPIRVPSPEDLVVMKAMAHNQESDSHWWDALKLMARAELDWPYLTKRAGLHGGYRLLALMFYGLSIGLDVDKGSINALIAAVGSERDEVAKASSPVGS